MKWKIIIVTHGPIFDEFYDIDSTFNYDNYTIFNVSNFVIKHDRFNIINKCEFKEFIHLGKQWAESEVVYNFFKNTELLGGLDFIGFIHYDYELFDGFTKKLNNTIEKDKRFISFSTFNFNQDFNQNIMLDEQYPNTLAGTGKNCFFRILEDYNNFFKTNVRLDDLMSKRINLCSAFITTINEFIDIGKFISNAIESKYLDQFDIANNHRIQGGMMERYIGLYSTQISFNEIEVFHNYRYYKK